MLKYGPLHEPRLCSAPLRKSYALRCVRGTNIQERSIVARMSEAISGEKQRVITRMSLRSSGYGYRNIGVHFAGHWR